MKAFLSPAKYIKKSLRQRQTERCINFRHSKNSDNTKDLMTKNQGENMCYHQLYIFMHCGHVILEPEPIPPLCLRARAFASSLGTAVPSLTATLPSRLTLSHPSHPSHAARARSTYHRLFPTPCEPRTHPFRANKIERLCLSCAREKNERLKEVVTEQEVRFEDWKWRVAYRSPRAEEKAWERWGDAGSAWGNGGDIGAMMGSIGSEMGMPNIGEVFSNVWGTDRNGGSSRNSINWILIVVKLSYSKSLRLNSILLVAIGSREQGTIPGHPTTASKELFSLPSPIESTPET
ncbi:hypothetical protein P152DRAFT_487988 [Eremomyces bilateralis CBS 781.70]|uniref:Uncharacterized protein n=1 Tax=Eremomyces bilateralis CBS 781.70 TaxID=1392243 RepID=A0A6G1G2T0_9PEZI|nr:uncharacterized protein P152DRAFT_487988 [Eremomyces bilateralis CBS 781.70]KAF1812364.1 hypothetical protein P152DRAFT_487988 [Eremomyces bilateralis CBS 781.70]